MGMANVLSRFGTGIKNFGLGLKYGHANNGGYSRQLASKWGRAYNAGANLHAIGRNIFTPQGSSWGKAINQSKIGKAFKRGARRLYGSIRRDLNYFRKNTGGGYGSLSVPSRAASPSSLEKTRLGRKANIAINTSDTKFPTVSSREVSSGSNGSDIVTQQQKTQQVIATQSGKTELPPPITATMEGDVDKTSQQALAAQAKAKELADNLKRMANNGSLPGDKTDGKGMSDGLKEWWNGLPSYGRGIAYGAGGLAAVGIVGNMVGGRRRDY